MSCSYCKAYDTLFLAKVTKADGTVEYFAVTKDTLENMEGTSADMTMTVDYGDGTYQQNQFTVENLGIVLVEESDELHSYRENEPLTTFKRRY